MNDVLWGALAMSAFVAGLFFVRFHVQTRDRLFLAFAAAFWLLGIQWAALGLLEVRDESRHLLYLVRLAAFGLILLAIFNKNRGRR